jgi:hypothetical protein
MQLDRRDLLKAFRSTALATAMGTQVAKAASPQTADIQEPAAVALPQGQIENPERLLDSEPIVTISPEGDATIAWRTVVATQGATIYLGLPNDEIALDWPIYSSSQAFTEQKPEIHHEATIDLRGYVNRSAARLMISGGIFYYRIELYDPRRAAIRFIDRHFRCAINNDRFRLALNINEGPFLTQISGDSAIAWWNTDRPATGELHLENGPTIASVSDARNRHVVRIPALQPGQSYSYQVSSRTPDDELRSRVYRLKTAPVETDFSFIFTCDGRTGALGGGETALEGVNGTSARALVAQMARHQPHFLFFTGDLISGYTTREDDFRAQLRSWKRIYAALWHEVPIYTGMGNHESLLDGFRRAQFDKTGIQSAESVFASEFLHPQNGPEPERPGLPPYKGAAYSFDYAGCHFVQLNSDYWYSNHPDEQPGNMFGRLLPGQLDWFDQDLAAARNAGAKHIFVFVHEPAFPNGGHVQDSLWGGGSPDGIAVRDRFWTAVNRAGVAAVFSGHEHNYSRTLIDNQTPVRWDHTTNPDFTKPTVQIIQGSAGAPFYARDLTVPWTNSVKKFVTHTWSYCLIKVQSQRVGLETYSYTGQMMDAADLA